MQTIVPRADAVGHDLFEAARPMAILGWATPAAMVARLALEHCVQSLATEKGVWTERSFPTNGPLVRRLEDAGVIGQCASGNIRRTYTKLDNVVQGEACRPHTVVDLIEAAERRVRLLEQLK